MRNDLLLMNSYSGAAIQVVNVQPGDSTSHRLSRNHQRRQLVKKHFPINERSLRSIEMQKQFEHISLNNLNIRSIPLLEAERSENEVVITMPYIHGLTAEELVLSGSTKIASKIREALSVYLSLLIARSRIVTVSADAFTEKLRTIGRNPLCDGIFSEAISIVLKQLQSLPSIQLPAGPYHGDLTFSNIIYSESSLYIFDFLPSFVDTFLLDYAKLRQEYLHHWSIRRLDKKSLMAAVQFIDDATPMQVISLIENSYPYQCKLISLINILRIVPYCKDEQTMDWLVRCTRLELEQFSNIL